MSKKNFAKKFVAYTMAFAVAFGTVNVSPIFVKDAQAAETDTPDLTDVTTPDTVFNGEDIILGTVTSSVKRDNMDAVKISDLISKLGATSVLKSNIKITESKISVGDTYANTYAMDAPVLGGGALASASTGKADNVGVIFNGETRDELKTGTKYEFANKGLKLGVAAGSDEYGWYKLVKDTYSYTRTYTENTTTKEETINVVYYKAKFVESNNGQLVFEDATEDNLGLYISIKLEADETVSADTYKLYNVYAKSDISAVAAQSDYKVNVGDSIKLEVIPTSTRKDLTYTWTKAGNKLEFDTPVVELKDIKSTDFGTYICTVNDGLKDASAVSITVAKAAYADKTNPSYTSIVKAKNPTDNKLANGTLTVTTCIPQNDGYRYVWTINGAAINAVNDMAENDVKSFDPNNNTLKITSIRNDIVTIECKAYEAKVFDEEEMIAAAPPKAAVLMDEYIKLADAATSDVEKYNMKNNVIGKVAFTGTPTPIFTETFYLVTTDNTTTSSDSVVGNVGEALVVNVPEIEAGKATVATGVDADRDAGTLVFVDDSHTTVQGLLSANNKTEIGQAPAFINVQNLHVDHFGTRRYVVIETYNENTYAEASSYNSGTNYYDNDHNEIESIVDSTSFAEYTGVKYTRTQTPKSVLRCEKFLNVVYNPDLTVSAEDIAAKVGSKAKLAVTTNSKLPVKCEWDFSKIASRPTFETGVDNTTKEFEVLSGDIYIPDNEATTADEEDNYVLCTVKNAYETKTIKICINKLGGYVAYDYEGNKILSSTDSETVLGVEDASITLKTNVVPSEGTNVTYSWHVGNASTPVLATTANYTVEKFSGSSEVYVCVITEEGTTEKLVITYNVTPLVLDDIVAIKVADVEDQVYTGKEIKPELTISVSTDGSTYSIANLTEGTDYTITYKENVNVGIARFELVLNKTDVEVKTQGKFFIDRAENEVEIANVDVKVGESVQPATVKNLANATLTYKYYSDASATTEIAVPTTEGTYYVVANADATANYNAAKSNIATVKISAADKEDEKPEEPGDDFVLGKTASIKAATTKSTSIKLAWEAVEGADAYRVYVYENGAYKVLADDLDALTFTAKNLTAGKKYVFAVKAFKDGKAAATFTKATLQTAPGVTSSIKVGRGYTSLKLTWNAVTGATGYRVYVAQDGKWVQVKKATTAKIFTKTGLKSGASYKFAVRAYRIEGSKVIWADTYKSVTAKTVKK